ncbi:amidohydrolase family protein [Nocardioides zeae]|uniref:Amidohydrolase family protein n=1 Tax=Nocardioides zeae TaxID=1457234 RepID=A0A6P0HNA5_9ACTN|nr:amidohydrolase family protein [Nocardioides zeae]NEN79724.1 amidohydrolase family protein [Nocardioides zeae]
MTLDDAVVSPMIDLHAHHFPRALTESSTTPTGPRWPHLRPGTDGRGQIMVGDAVFRHVTADLWDVETKLLALDRAGIGVQVVSPVPVMLCTWADAADAAAYCRAVNVALAEDVATAPSRLRGLGAVPLQDVERAVVELHHAVATLGLLGVEIGTSVEGVDLDDPRLHPFWAAAEDLGAVVFVHPMDGGGGVVRRAGQPYDFGLGMLTDTAIAAGGLVFGGVLARFPALKVVLAHGCGSFAWSYPRLRLGDQVWNGGDPAMSDDRARSLWVDTLVLDPEHLRILVHRFGPDKVVLGTDHPFFPAVTAGARDFVGDAVASGALTRAQGEGVLHRNAAELLGLGSPSTTQPAETS